MAEEGAFLKKGEAAGSDFTVIKPDLEEELQVSFSDKKRRSGKYFVSLRHNFLYFLPEKGSDDTDNILNLERLKEDGIVYSESAPNDIKLKLGSSHIILSCPDEDSSSSWRHQIVSKIAVTLTVESLNTPQKEAFDIFQKKATEDEGTAEYVKRKNDKAEFIRFLVVNNFDVEKSFVAFREYVFWRSQYAVDDMKISDVAQELRTDTLFLPTGLKDVAGRPIMLYFFKNHDPKVSSPLETVKSMIYLFERAFESMTEGVQEICLLSDCTGMSLRKYDDRTEKLVFDMIRTKYPGRIGVMVVCNAPWYFRFLWKIIARWMPQDFAQMTHVMKSGKPIAFADEANLPVALGGTQTHDQEEYIAQRYAIEGIPPGTLTQPKMDERVKASLASKIPAGQLEDVQHIGWMHKLGGVVKNWKHRFFVLKDGLLYYFKKEQSSEPQGIVFLASSKVSPESHKAKPTSFSLVTPLRQYYFVPKNDEEKKAWMEELQKACDEENKRKFAALSVKEK